MGKETRVKIIREARRIEEDCLYSAKGHFYTAQFWTNLRLWIGIPTAILAAISGASALSHFDNHNILAGILAIIVTSLTAVSTFLNPNEKAMLHHKSGNKYNSLRNKSRIFCEIDIDTITDDNDIVQQLKILNQEKDGLNLKSPQIPKWAYSKARRGIEEGEADYGVDK